MEHRLFNNLQTQLTSNILKEFDGATISDIYEAIEQIPFIDVLTNPHRRKIKDVEKDPRTNRIIVDMTNPHILEDMAYFRKAAAHYEEFGTYTHLYPNRNPQSEYSLYWKEEARRCREGYDRESDGEWVSGDYYFYLNYSPIMLTKALNDKKGDFGESIRADRVDGFPYIYDGDYFYYHYIENTRHRGKHGFVLKSRGKGFSFKGGSGLGKRFVIGESTRSKKNVKSFALANEKEYLIKDGVMNKFVDITDFLAKNTPWPRRKELKDSWNDMHWKMGYKDPITNVESGTKNEVIGVTLRNDAQKARGKRGTYIIWEEVGKLPNFIQAWGIARPSVEDGNFTFGTMIAYGTGGTEGADFEGAEEAFYNPNGHNIHGVKNIFDKNSDQNICSFFFPEYLNRSSCYDENGNSDVIKALLQIFTERNKIRFGTSDPNILVQEKAERPITPQEAIMRKEGSIFPVLDLKDYLADIMPRQESFIGPHYVGRLRTDPTGHITWKPDDTVNIIRDYPIKHSISKVGGVEIFEQPVKGPRGIPPVGIYIAGTDPVDDDHSSTDSVCCTYIMNVLTDRIVAEYTSREHTAEQYYENTLRLLQYYNAQCNYENDKKGMFAYFKKKHCLHYICDTPEILKDMDMVKSNMYGNKAKGTNSGKRINEWGRRLLADWMVTPSYKEDPEEEDVMGMYKIRSIGLLKEAIAWNPDGNFDRISAMGMLMIMREDRINRRPTNYHEDDKETMKDPFFKKFFDGGKGSIANWGAASGNKFNL